MRRHPSDPEQPAPGAVLLGQVADLLPVLKVACTRCERRGRLRTDRLLAAHGGQTPMPELRRVLSADCPKRVADQVHDPCGAHFPDLARLRL